MRLRYGLFVCGSNGVINTDKSSMDEMTLKSKKMKIIILDQGWPQTANLIMHLSRAGLEVVRVAAGPFDRIGLGHYCRNISLPDYRVDANCLKSILDSEKADLVLPLCEDYLMTLWALPEADTKNVFPEMNYLQKSVLTDRLKMYELATSVGVTVPDCLLIDEKSALEGAADKFGFPFVLRGTQGLCGAQVKVVRNPLDASEAYHSLIEQSPGTPFAQPFIHGTRHLIGGLFSEGEMLQWFSQKTLEASSPPTGPSIRVKSVRNETLTGYARSLFKELNWNGLACAEFILGDDNNFYFMEINPRPWAAIQAAHVCGVPLLQYFVDYLLGKEIPPRKEFLNNKEICLFPQFFCHRVSNLRFESLRDINYYSNCLLYSPWKHPFLYFHYLRTIFWSRN